ncbi:MAG: hypothetical protein LBV03_02425 [Fusobacteriales bacterium]|nr:hypothetical protein [Fusobacteriales bacterium]
MKENLKKEINNLLSEGVKKEIKIPMLEIESALSCLVNEQKIINYNVDDLDSKLDIENLHKLIKLGEVTMSIRSLISFSKILNYYYIDYYFKLENLDEKIFYLDELRGDLWEDTVYEINGIFETLKQRLETLEFNFLERNEEREVIKDLPDPENNFFFSQLTIKAILFYDIYNLLEN